MGGKAMNGALRCSQSRSQERGHPHVTSLRTHQPLIRRLDWLGAVVTDPGLCAAAYRIAGFIAYAHDDKAKEPVFRYSVDAVARELHVTRTTVRTGLSSLRASGYLRYAGKPSKGRCATAYSLAEPETTGQELGRFMAGTGQESGALGSHLDSQPPLQPVGQPTSNLPPIRGNSGIRGITPSSPSEGYCNSTAMATALSMRVEGVNVVQVRSAVASGDLLALVSSFGANVKGEGRADEWRRDADALQLGTVALIFSWMRDREDPIREPSGFRRARDAWLQLPKSDRARLMPLLLAEYGLSPTQTVASTPREAVSSAGLETALPPSEAKPAETF